MYFEVYIYVYITKLLLLVVCVFIDISSAQFVMVESLGVDWFARLTGEYALQSTCRSYIERIKQVARLLQQFYIASNKQQQQLSAASTSTTTVSATATTDATAATAVTAVTKLLKLLSSVYMQQ
jgi:hypothetical protein